MPSLPGRLQRVRPGLRVLCDRCLQEEEVKTMAFCIELDRSCVDPCSLAVRERVRGSRFGPAVCGCARKACRRVAAA